MKIKYIKSLIINTLILLSITFIWGIQTTNAPFKASDMGEEVVLDTKYWVAPKINFTPDSHNYIYDRNDTLKLNWIIEMYNEKTTPTIELYIREEGTNDFTKISGLPTNFQFEDVAAILKFSKNEGELKFKFKLKIKDSHGLEDTSTSNMYTFKKEQTDTISNSKNDDVNSSNDSKDSETKDITIPVLTATNATSSAEASEIGTTIQPEITIDSINSPDIFAQLVKEELGASDTIETTNSE